MRITGKKVRQMIWHGLIAELYESDRLENDTFQVLISGIPFSELFKTIQEAKGLALELIRKYKYMQPSEMANRVRAVIADYNDVSYERIVWHKMVTLMNNNDKYETKIFNLLEKGIPFTEVLNRSFKIS